MPTDNLPSNLYSGGAVVLNSNPSMEFYEQHLMRQQAKQDSLDQYYRSLDNKLDSVGMNPEDRQKLLQMENQKMDYYIQNRQKILNPRLDNGATQMGYQRMYGQMQNLVNESKDNWKNHQLVAGKLADAAQKGIMIPDGWMSDLHSDSKGVYNGYNRFDPTRLADLTATPDRAKLLQAYQKLPKEDVNYSQQALPNMQVADVTTKQWKPEQYDNALAMARSDVHTNQGAFTIAHQIASNPDDVKRYTDVYKQATGKDLQPGDLGGLYFGYALANGVDKEVTPGQPRDNRAAVLEAENKNRLNIAQYTQGQENYRMRENNKARDARQRMAGGGTGSELSDATHTDIEDRKAAASQEHFVGSSTTPGNRTRYRVLDVPEDIKKHFKYKSSDGKTEYDPDFIGVDDEGAIRAISYKKEGGEPVVENGYPKVDEGNSRIINQQDLEDELANAYATKPHLAKAYIAKIKSQHGGVIPTRNPTSYNTESDEATGGVAPRASKATQSKPKAAGKVTPPPPAHNDKDPDGIY